MARIRDAQGEMKMASYRLIEFPLPHRINPWRGAEPEDVAHVRRQVEAAFTLAENVVGDLMQNITEHMPFNTTDLNQAVFAAACDLIRAKKVLVDALIVAEDRLVEDR